MKSTGVRLNRSFISELVALYGVQIANIVVPILTLPILSHSLGAQSYGTYVIIQSVSLIISLVIEYGFTFSATRLIAKSDDDQHKSIVSNVTGAKIILSIVAILGTIVLFYVYLSHRSDVGYYALTSVILSALSLGWLPTWYFQGKGILSQFALFDVFVKGFAALLLFLLVKQERDINIALGITTISYIVSCVYGNLKMLKCVGNLKILPKESFNFLRYGKDMAIYRLLSSSIGSINTLILGSLATTSFVANYSGAEKLVSGARFFIAPFNQIFFARVSRYGRSEPGRAKKEFLYSFWILMIIAILIVIIGWFLSPWIVELFLGKSFFDSILIMRYLLLITPLYVIGNTLSMQWMVPLGMDRAYNNIVGWSSLANIVFILISIRKFGPISIVWIVGITELIICISMILYLAKMNKNPFSRNTIPLIRGDR